MSNASQADLPPVSGYQQASQLTAAQLEAIRKQLIAEFQRAVDDVEMRKQAVEAVCKIIAANPSLAVDPMHLARNLYAFMAEPAAEIVVKIS